MSREIFLLRELVRRDFAARYAGSVLGFLWSFVQPLWQLLLFTFVFSTVMKISPVGERTDSFGIFLFCGLLPWTALSEGVTRSATAITENAALVKKLSFPSELLVGAVTLAALLHEAIAALIFVVVLVWLGELSVVSLPLLLLALPVQVALTLGLGMILASVHVFFRDTAQFVGMFMMGWFYFTPIVYPVSLVPDDYRPYIDINPLTPLVGLYRAAFLGSTEPGLPPGTIYLIIFSLVLLLGGWWLFRRLRATFADEI
ncbi:MAG: ABC transporter permease [Acidobacteriota bacterium]